MTTLGKFNLFSVKFNVTNVKRKLNVNHTINTWKTISRNENGQQNAY